MEKEKLERKQKNKRKKFRLPKFKHTIVMAPNLLTFVRIFVVPIIVLLMYLQWKSPNINYDTWAAWIFILAAVTDFFDGYLARRMRIKSAVGKILDPLADKLMVLSILIMLIPLARVPAYLVAILMAREFIITALRTLASAAGIIIPADKLGKLKTVFQMIAIPLMLFEITIFSFHSHTLGLYLLWIAVLFSVISAFLYIKRFFDRAKDLEF